MAQTKKEVISIDPSLQYERMLHYKAKHSGWIIYKSVFWGIYAFILGVLLLTKFAVTTPMFVGWALVLFAVFYILNGFARSLHLKLMKKHG